MAGAIPLIRPLRESLAGDRVTRFLGIVNGTTNYVLDQMDTTGAGFADAVERAQALGYAEADPTADVEGYDAASKAAILASLAFHTRVPGEAVHREGITGVTAADVAAAARMGCVVKLLAIGSREPAGPDGPEGVTVRVHPAFVPRSHPLAGVRGPFNAVFVEAEAAGELDVLRPRRGRHADRGRRPRRRRRGRPAPGARRARAGGVGLRRPRRAAACRACSPRYHVRLEVADRPGVLARVADAFAAHGVSIEQVRQQAVGEGEDRTAELVVVTHVAPDTALSDTVADLAGLDVVLDVTSVMRVEGE